MFSSFRSVWDLYKAAKNETRVGVFLLASFSVLGIAPVAQAQVPGDPSAAQNQIQTPPIEQRNNFGTQLTPQVKPPPGNKPYAPIRANEGGGDVPEIEMFVGESRVFPTPGVARIAVGNGQIMTAAALDDKETIVFANGVGTSSLFVWNADGRYQRIKINILAGDTSRIARELTAFLKGTPNAKTSIVGDKVIVEGENLSDHELSRIEELTRRYPQVVNFTNQIGWEQMVLLDVKVCEFPTTYLKEMGLRWGPTGGAAIGGIWGPLRRHGDGYIINLPTTGGASTPPISGGGGPSGTTVIPSGLNILSVLNLGIAATLDLLQQEGKISILAQPQLSARSGGKATFLAGGEFPITIATPNGVTVIYKEFGVKLNIEPLVGRNGVVRAKVGTEVSAIDSSISTIGGPGLKTRKTDTEFNLYTGETIVLSGLISRESSSDVDKVPFLGDIPILGALFRSKRYENRETELVVFVTPTIIDAKSPGMKDRIERANERLYQELGPAPHVTVPLQPGMDPSRPNDPPPIERPIIPPLNGALDPSRQPAPGSNEPRLAALR